MGRGRVAADVLDAVPAIAVDPDHVVDARSADLILADQLELVRGGSRPPHLHVLRPGPAREDIPGDDAAAFSELQRSVNELDVRGAIWGGAIDNVVPKDFG